MKFYDRENEMQMLHEIDSATHEGSQMTVLVGRRRIGKTKLLIHVSEGKPAVYFFVSRKSESILCSQFVEEAERGLGMPIGAYHRLADLLEHLMRLSQSMPFTLIIDEFQELLNIDASIIGDIQRVWDLNKDRSRINLLLSGSVYSMMHRIFEDNKEPLFSRASNIMHIHAFRTDVLKDILRDHNARYTNEDLLALYTFTGGVAWYVELLIIESGNIELLKQTFLRDYPTFSGVMLERYFRQKAGESGRYTHIGNFWDRTGDHEIDLILANELDKTVEIGEVKRQAKNICPTLLQDKTDYFLTLHPQLQSYRKELLHLDLQDM